VDIYGGGSWKPPSETVEDHGVGDHGVGDHGVKDHGVKDHGVKDHGADDGDVGDNLHRDLLHSVSMPLQRQQGTGHQLPSLMSGGYLQG